jgi:phosphatidylethanolamine-binding protein (PEBP) family uncharacterized protein
MSRISAFSVQFCMVLALMLTVSPYANAGDFGISFEWLKSSQCTGGYPDMEKNPIFSLSNVPNGTKIIQFVMDDDDASYDHGGGKVEYTGQNTIESGAFTYEGPCPPSTHHYVWTATAKDAGGKTIGKAKAARYFPE